MWRAGSGPGMDGAWQEVIHVGLCLAGLGGLVLLALRRRREALVIALLVLGITAIGAVLLASARRNLILMPIVIALAGMAVSWLVAALSSGRSWSPAPPPRRGLPLRADGAPRRRTRDRRRDRRLRDHSQALAAQRRRPDPARERVRAGHRQRHRADQHAARGLLVRRGQRRAHHRRRRLRDPDPLPARPARALAGIADQPRALRRARGNRLGGVPQRRASRSGSAARSRS